MPKLKPGQRIEWLTNYSTLGGGGRSIREQATMPAAMPVTMPTATMPPAAPKPAAPKLTAPPAAPKPAAPDDDPRENIFNHLTDKMVELLDDESADPVATAKQIAALLATRAKVLADYDAATGSTESATRPAAKPIRRSKAFGRAPAKRVDLGLDPNGPHVVGPENVDDGLEHFLAGIRGRGVNSRASSGLLENVRAVTQGEEYLTEESRLAPDSTAEFLAGLRIIRE